MGWEHANLDVRGPTTRGTSVALIADQDESALEQNRRRLLQEFRREVAQYERRYEIPSTKLQAALRDGRLQETAEVAAWLLLLAALALLAREGSRQASAE